MRLMMHEVMTLIEIIHGLEGFDYDDTIYAAKPWQASSTAVVAREPYEGGCPRRRRSLV